MVRAAAVGEQPGMDARVERLDPAIEHLGEARDVGDIGHRQTRVAQRPRRPARADQLEPAFDQARPELGQPGLVRHREQCPPRDPGAIVERRGIERRATRAGRARDRAGEERRHGRGQEPVLDGVETPEQAGLIVAREHRDRLLGHDRPAVERRVDEMDGDAGHGDAGRERIAHGVEARECRQQRGMDVEDPPLEAPEDRGSDEAQVAGEDQRVGRDRGERVGEDRVVATRHERGLDPLLARPVERGTRAIGEHQRHLAAERATRRGTNERPQVRPGSRHPDGDPPHADVGHLAHPAHPASA